VERHRRLDHAIIAWEAWLDSRLICSAARCALLRVCPSRAKAPALHLTELAAVTQTRCSRLGKTLGGPLRWPRMMTEDRKSLETLIEEASRARRYATVLYGDQAADDLERYAEELEDEIHRRQPTSEGQDAGPRLRCQ
jgi:hypothetical protein